VCVVVEAVDYVPETHRLAGDPDVPLVGDLEDPRSSELVVVARIKHVVLADHTSFGVRTMVCYVGGVQDPVESLLLPPERGGVRDRAPAVGTLRLGEEVKVGRSPLSQIAPKRHTIVSLASVTLLIVDQLGDTGTVKHVVRVVTITDRANTDLTVRAGSGSAETDRTLTKVMIGHFWIRGSTTETFLAKTTDYEADQALTRVYICQDSGWFSVKFVDFSSFLSFYTVEPTRNEK